MRREMVKKNDADLENPGAIPDTLKSDLEDHMKLLYGRSTGKKPHIVSKAFLKANAFFWNTFPLSLSRPL